MRKVIALCLIALWMAISLAAHAEEVAPGVLVKNIAEDVLSVIRQNHGTPTGSREEILKLVNAKVLPHFNFERMTRLAIGKNWRNATPMQRNALVVEFRNLLVNTYTNAFARYQNQTVEVKPVQMSSGVNEVTVKTHILKPGVQRVTVNYEMEKTPEGWKVFDLTVEGVSLVISYRSTFGREVRLNGIDGLIKTLLEKNAANNAAH